MANLFRQAAGLLKAKDAGGELTEDEFKLINTAEIPLMVKGCPFPEDMTIRECLKELAKIIEEGS